MIAQQLVTQHRKKLIGFFRKKGVNQWDAEELTQDVLMRFIQYQERSNCRNINAYLYTIAQSVFTNSIRKSARSKEYLVNDSEWIDIEVSQMQRNDSPELALEAEQVLMHLIKSIGRLTDAPKQVYVMRYIKGYSCAEIALRRNVSVSAIEKSVTRARLMVSERMQCVSV